MKLIFGIYMHYKDVIIVVFLILNYNEEISTVAISQIIVDDISIFHYQSLLNNNAKQSILLLQ